MSADERRYVEVGKAVLANFEDRNARAKAAGELLTAEIERVMSADDTGGELTAKRIMRLICLGRIGRDSLPTERTVQWHVQRIRKRKTNTERDSSVLRRISVHHARS